MAKFKFKFKFLCPYGQGIKTKIIELDAPDFIDITNRYFEGIKLPDISIDEQAIQWLDGLDKSEIMDENNMYIIIDYKVYNSKVKKSSFKDYISSIEISDDLAIQLLATYSRIGSTLVGSNSQKLKTLLAVTSLGIEASSIAYKNIINLLNSDKLLD